MNRILIRGIGIPLLVGGMVSCMPAEPEPTPYPLSFNLPITDGALQSLTFDPQVSIGGDFKLVDSPCDPGLVDVYGDLDHGFSVWPAWDVNECLETPASPPEGEGNLQLYLDGFYFGSYSDVSQFDFSPKLTMVYYDYVVADWDQDVLTADTAEPVGVCNFYFPDSPQAFNQQIADTVVAALQSTCVVEDEDEEGNAIEVEVPCADVYGSPGVLTVKSSSDPATAVDLENQMDFQVWFWNIYQTWWFSYMNDFPEAFGGGFGHMIWAQLADHTHSPIYGSLTDRVLFDAFPEAELASWSADNGLPWCGAVPLLDLDADGTPETGVSTPYTLYY